MIVDLMSVFEYEIEMYVMGVHLKATVFNIRCSLSYCLSFWCRMNVHGLDEFVAPVSIFPLVLLIATVFQDPLGYRSV